jgi:hypothetical protein
MADILQFPNKRQQSVNEKVGILRNRLEELATEADLIADDISYLQDMQAKGIAESEEIMKEISELLGIAIPPEVEWPEEFEEGTVYPKKDTATDKWDDIANKTLDTSLKLLEDAVKQLQFDFNKDNPDNKPKDK